MATAAPIFQHSELSLQPYSWGHVQTCTLNPTHVWAAVKEIFANALLAIYNALIWTVNRLEQRSPALPAPMPAPQLTQEPPQQAAAPLPAPAAPPLPAPVSVIPPAPPAAAPTPEPTPAQASTPPIEPIQPPAQSVPVLPPALPITAQASEPTPAQASTPPVEPIQVPAQSAPVRPPAPAAEATPSPSKPNSVTPEMVKSITIPAQPGPLHTGTIELWDRRTTDFSLTSAQLDVLHRDLRHVTIKGIFHPGTIDKSYEGTSEDLLTQIFSATPPVTKPAWTGYLKGALGKTGKVCILMTKYTIQAIPFAVALAGAWWLLQQAEKK